MTAERLNEALFACLRMETVVAVFNIFVEMDINLLCNKVLN